MSSDSGSGQIPSGIPASATASGLSHASRLMWEVVHEIRRYTAQYKDRQMKETWHKALDAVNVLTRMGADCPIGDPAPMITPRAVWELDTPEARELLSLLQRAQALAEKVDAQRGNVLPDRIPTSEMESRGTDYADSISHLAIRLHLEIVPPKGRD